MGKMLAAEYLAARGLKPASIESCDCVRPASTRAARNWRPELMLEALSVLGGTLVATESPNARSLQAGDLASRAEPYFRHVEPLPDPQAARGRALALAGGEGAVVVTGSLYLLSELHGHG